jgi:chaperonin GroES
VVSVVGKLEVPETGPYKRRYPSVVNREVVTVSIRPLQDRILIKRVREEEKTKGGIIIPDSAKEKPVEGKVIAVGNGAIQKDGKVRKLEVKQGDIVLFAKYSGSDIKIEGEDHLILREEDILAIIER